MVVFRVNILLLAFLELTSCNPEVILATCKGLHMNSASFSCPEWTKNDKVRLLRTLPAKFDHEYRPTVGHQVLCSRNGSQIEANLLERSHISLIVSQEMVKLNLLPNRRAYLLKKKDIYDLWDMSLIGTVEQIEGNYVYKANTDARSRLEARTDLQGRELIVRVSAQPPFNSIPDDEINRKVSAL